MTHTTLAKLQAKKANSSNRMPNLASISKMLTDLGVAHEYYPTQLNIKEAHIRMDSTEAYYSWNTHSYARQLLNYLATKGIA